MFSRHDLYNQNSLECVKSNKPTVRKLTLLRQCLYQRADVNATDKDGNTPLHLAVRCEWALIVKLLLKRGANVNKEDKYGKTSLHYAVCFRKTNILELLLKKDADVNARCRNGGTPLYTAAQCGQTSIVKLLLNEDADVNAQTDHEDTPLHGAMRSGNIEVVELLLYKGADVNAKNRGGYTPLHKAAHSGNMPVVELLLNKGANVNVHARGGHTPLYEAVHFGNTSLVQLLLNQDADVNAQTRNRDISFGEAMHFRKMGITDLFLDKGYAVNAETRIGYSLNFEALHLHDLPLYEDADIDTSLHRAMHSKNIFDLDPLLNESADLNATSRGGYTPLHKAAHSGNMPVVELLLNKGANVNVQARGGQTPLHEAARSGNTSVVELLLNKGADVKALSGDGNTPLHNAVQSRNTTVIELLLNKGADVNAQTRDGNTPLHRAMRSNKMVENLLQNKGTGVNMNKGVYKPQHEEADSGNRSVVELLCNKGANVKAQTRDGYTQLHEAVHSENETVVELLLHKGANVSVQNRGGYTPLHDAVQSGNTTVVELLLNKGADMNAQSKDGNTPLHGAMRSREFAVVELLLNKGADVNVRTTDGYTPLHEAVHSGKISFVELLLNKGANVNVQKRGGYTLLHDAVQSGNTTVVELLLKKGADVNAQSKDGNTPLHGAMRSREFAVVELLLYKGADVNVRTTDGYTPLHEAAHSGKISFVELLLNKGANVNVQKSGGYTPLHDAVQSGNTTVVELLLNRGADVNAQSKDGNTPLHAAMRSREMAVVELLLKKGADVNAKTTGGYTPLHEAANSGNISFVKLLLEKDADVNAHTRDGDTPLHGAIRSKKIDVIKLLIIKGADVNGQKSDGEMPLHEAVSSKDIPVMELLLKKGADINTKTKDGHTLLYRAVHSGETSVVELLLSKGADANEKDEAGKTLLHEAVISGETTIAKLLLENNADVNARDKHKKTPLLEAVSSGKTSVVALLLNEDADVNVRDGLEDTPLHKAAQHGQTAVVQLLLDKDADINAQNSDGITPLHKAVCSRENSVTELLLKKGANVNARDRFNNTPLHEAASRGLTNDVKLLLDKGADVNAQRSDHETPLHKAVYSKDRFIVELLLKKGANVNARDKLGDTPLHKAAQRGHTSDVKLLKKETDVDAFELDRITPLHKAMCSKEESIVELLLKKSADVDAQNKQEKTPLHETACFKRTSIAKLLLNKNANINMQKIDGETPLHVAVRHEHVALATLLVNHGANVMLRNNTGETPLTYALLFFFKGNEEIVKLLQAAEKNVSNNTVASRDISQSNGQHNMTLINSLTNDELKYSKTSDTSGLPGQLYETNMVSLIFIRALNHKQIEHDFFLGVNIHGIGALDDICLRYRVRDRQTPIVLFMQVKHRENPGKDKLTDKALWCDSGDFSLRKYFKSYLMIRERFRVGNEDSMFEGEISDIDCYFILYTSAKESITKKKIGNKMSDIEDDLINTGENSEPFQYSYDEADIERLIEVAAEAQIEAFEAISFSKQQPTNNPIKHAEQHVKDFFGRLWFYPGQAKEENVEQKVKDEISKHYNKENNRNNYKFELHSNAIFLRAHDEIEKWWMQKNKMSYLTRSDDFFRHAKLACLADVLLTGAHAINYLKITVDLEFNNFFELPDTSIEISRVFNTILCRLFSLINTDNILLTIDMEFKQRIVNLLLNEERLEGASGLQRSDQSQKFWNYLKSNCQDGILNNDQHNIEQFEYSKTTGSSEAGGALFRTKALSLVLLRMLNHEQIDQDPLLATKIQGISFMSDICLRFGEKGQQRPAVLFMQLIHREDPESGPLTVEELWSDSGNFSLRKYFASYLDIKDRFQGGNKDPMFKGEFRDVDCYFVLYTSARERFTKKKTENKMSKVVQDLISTKQTIEYFQFHYDEADIDRLSNVTSTDRIENLGIAFLPCLRLPEKYNPNFLTDKFIARYHVAMAREVLRPCEKQPEDENYRLWQFRSEFFNSDLEHLLPIRKIFVKHYLSKRCEQRKMNNALQQNVISGEEQKVLEKLKMKLPLAFGNLDMTFRESTLQNRIETLASTLIYLLKSNKDKKVEINGEDVGPKKAIEQGIIDVNGGIGSAVGNLLVLDTESNMLKFDLNKKPLPHNVALFLKELQNDKYKPFNIDLNEYRIKVNVFDFPRASFDEDEYDKIQVREFFNNFWFYPDQAKEDEMERYIKDEINKKNTKNKNHYNNDSCGNISDLISLHDTRFTMYDVLHDVIRKWWLQTRKSHYLNRASKLFENAELADIYNLLQTVINYMYISKIYSIDIKVRRLNKDDEANRMQEVFEKIVAKLFNLFDPQFEEHYELRRYEFEISERSTLSLRIHPEMEWVALSVTRMKKSEFENANMKHCFVAKAGPGSGRGRAMDGFVLRQLYSCGRIYRFKDCIKNTNIEFFIREL